MFKLKKILAIIPARAGSKGIKDKNIIDLNGKPLIAYSIEAGLKSKYIDKVVVTTDGEEIAREAIKYGAEVPFLRPEYLSSDNAKTIDAVIHCIEEMEKLGEKYDYVVLLQPTQPLRQSWHIDEAIELILEKNEEALVSVSNGYAVNLLSESSTKRRQDFQDFYKVNGAIYINKINQNLNNKTSLNDNKLVYIMDEKYDVDIITNEKINNNFLKNNSEPFIYTLGLFFEMARVLKERQDR